MKTWQATTEQELLEMLLVAERKMTSAGRKVWKLVQLEKPEKWQLSPWGDEGGGFWVVSIAGNTCLYYNDIEDGFNSSAFKEWGVIDQYTCDQTELQDVFNCFTNSSS